MLVLGAGEQLAERTQHGKDAGLPAARLFRKPGAALADLAVDAVAAVGQIAGALHEIPPGTGRLGGPLEPSPGNAKAAGCSEAAYAKNGNRWPPGLDGPPPIG